MAAEATGGPGPGWLEDVGGGASAWVQPDGSWYINTTGVVVGSRGSVLAVDTCATRRRTLALLAAVEARTGRLPATLVNTHHHGDHTNGNCLLPDATRIGRPRCRDEILGAGILRPDGLFDPVDWGDLVPAPPTVLVDDRLDVWVDDTLVELHAVAGRAHTDNDLLAWLPEARVLFVGDLVFNGGTPFILMGSVAGSLAALDRIDAFAARVVVPGHGPPCGSRVIARCRDYLRWLGELAASGVAAGATPLEAARGADLSPFSDLLDPERLVGNLHAAYAELSADPRPVDVLAAFADMITWNGGRPLRCCA